MFNDPLDKPQCEELVRRLAECVLPFQCAHGRPSMVPLVDLGAVSGGLKGGGEAYDDVLNVMSIADRTNHN